MSVFPPPPPAGGASGPPPPPITSTPAPPPPPPNLTAPSGYVGYSPTPVNAVGLYRIGKLTKAAIALAGASAIVTLLSIVALQAAQDDAQLLLDDSIDVEEFVQRALPYLLTSVMQAVATLAAAIVTIIGMYRIQKTSDRSAG
ncbi:MAG: hypothetical protein WKF60_10720, partial [Ilumatobacter sp.]